ncbi:MAG TPA: ABC transporter permease [Nocardioidaceae bacterium]|nr:ABC transporter permease [Nocardioidaceae bacterium]
MTSTPPATTAGTVDGAVSGSGSPTGARVARVVQRQGALVILVAVMLIASLAFDTFGSRGNLTGIAMQSSFLAVVSLGMTFVIMTGGIDLSVGSVFALGGVLAAWGSQYGALAALLLPLVICGLIGLVQGLLVARAGLPAFIVTLAGLLFARGLLLLISNEGSTTYKVPQGSGFLELARGELLGIKYPVWIVLVLFLIAGLVLHRTSYGSTVLAIGGQEDAADLMGLPVQRTKVVTYVLSAVLAGFGGAMIASYTASGVTILGVGMELDAIAAVVLGGTLLTGGAGTILGTLVGVLLLQVIKNVINQVGSLDSDWQAVVSGTILLVVVTVQRYLTRVERS